MDKYIACLYCGEVMNMPSKVVMKKFKSIKLDCCGVEMITLNKSNLYKLLKGLRKLQEFIEKEIVKDF